LPENDTLKQDRKIDPEDKDTGFVTVAKFVNVWRTYLLLQKQSEASHSDYVNLLWLVNFMTLILAGKTQI